MVYHISLELYIILHFSSRKGNNFNQSDPINFTPMTYGSEFRMSLIGI